MATNKGTPPRGSTGDVMRGVANGGVGSRGGGRPMPSVPMPGQGPGATPGGAGTPGGDGGATHARRFPPQKPLPPAPWTVGKRPD
jgi:hypothetical protein